MLPAMGEALATVHKGFLGRVLFVDHCAKCHAYPAVHAVPDEKWPQVMHSMAKKSHLGPDDEQKMLRFVLTAGARSGT